MSYMPHRGALGNEDKVYNSLSPSDKRCYELHASWGGPQVTVYETLDTENRCLDYVPHFGDCEL